MNFKIEKAASRDIDDIYKILKLWNMHYVPSSEVEKLDLSCFFVAKNNNQIVGVCGYKMRSKKIGSTLLLAVYPEYQGFKIGHALQEKRLEVMYGLGVKKVITNTDRADTVLWYKKNFNYYEVGKLKKTCIFGVKDINYWTTLEMDLDEYFDKKEEKQKNKKLYIYENDSYPLKPYSPLIINVALTGMIPTKNLTPFVPISVDEIIEDAIKVCDAGASIVHLHVRDQNGKPTYKTKYYEQVILGIRRERPELICCVSTSGRDFTSFEQRSEVLHLEGKAKPDMASLTLGSLNFLNGASVNSLEMIQRLAILMKEKNIKPELEVFDTGMINIAKYLERHNIIGGEKYFNFILGNINTASANILELSHLYNSLPTNSTWSAGGIGSFQLPINMAAISAGGNVRVGIEDNIYYDINKNKLATNEEMVNRISKISQELQRDVSSPNQTRRWLGL